MDEASVDRMFSEGYDCSQIVLSAVADRLGITRDLALSSASGLGIGLCRGSICGAALGALVAIGIRYGNTSPGDMASKAMVFSKREEFLSRFEEMNGKLLCKDFLGVRVTDLGDMIVRSADGIYDGCSRYCVNAISILEEML